MTQNAGEQLHIAAICGSLRAESLTRFALNIVLQGAKETGATTRLIDLRDYDLPFCRGKEGPDLRYGPDVARLKVDVAEAQGIILGTPEYHGSYSGVLKNAIDLMGFPEFGGKMVGLVAVSGGAMGALHAMDSLRAVGRSLHAWVIPRQVVIPQAWKRFDENGVLQDPRFDERLREVGREVARFAFLHSSEQAQEFLRLWEEAQPNPGG